MKLFVRNSASFSKIFLMALAFSVTIGLGYVSQAQIHPLDRKPDPTPIGGPNSHVQPNHATHNNQPGPHNQPNPPNQLNHHNPAPTNKIGNQPGNHSQPQHNPVTSGPMHKPNATPAPVHPPMNNVKPITTPNPGPVHKPAPVVTQPTPHHTPKPATPPPPPQRPTVLQRISSWFR